MTIHRFAKAGLLAIALSLASGGAQAQNIFQMIFLGGGGLTPPASGPRGPLPYQFQRQRVRYDTAERPGTIVIDTKQKFLYLVEDDGRALRYGVGVGREGFGWHGIVRVGRKAEWPDWRPPSEMIVRERHRGHIIPAFMAGGPGNPLGARAMYLYGNSGDTMFRIHGTVEPWTIGHNVSSGCIRLVNADVTDLYERVPVGTKVIVR
jgi:lipoprotein-anchoring transpeptidase ErfK/SrfK